MATTIRKIPVSARSSTCKRPRPAIGRTLFALAVTAILVTGCPPPHASKPVLKNGKECGVTSGWIWRPTWWNFHERGESYASCDLFEQATQDFRAAIERRAADQRHARTYGMHFLDDYFPHRELGIALYRQGKLDEAERELLESLGAEPSARAKYYLNETRRDSLRRRGLKAAPGPTIELDGGARIVTREPRVRLSGRVRSPQYVATLAVAGERPPIELAKTEQAFDVEVAVDPGDSTLAIATADLLGNSSTTLVHVTSDRQGPVVAIQTIETVTGGAIEIRATAHDPSGLATIEIGGVSERPTPTDTAAIRIRLPRPPDDRVRFLTADGVGNETRGVIVLEDGGASGSIRSGSTLLAALESDLPAAAPLPSAPSRVLRIALGPEEIRWRLGEKIDVALDRSPPLVRVDGLTDTQTVYQDRILVSGSASDDSRVVSIQVDHLVAEVRNTNDGPVPAEQATVPAEHQTLSFTPGKDVFFSALVPLGDGPNELRIVTTDLAGKRSERVIEIVRKRPAIEDPSVRLAVAPMPFREGEALGDLSERLEGHLVDGLVNQRRYRIVDRITIAQAMQEKSLVLADLVDPDHAIDVARTTPAEAILVGRAYRRGASLEAWVKLVDTETSESLTLSDVYGENLGITDLAPLMAALAQKVALAIPRLEAPVIAVEDDEITIAKGQADKIQPNLRVALFRAGAPAVGALASVPRYTEIARGRTRTVDASLTHAELAMIDDASPRAGDLVVIR